MVTLGDVDDVNGFDALNATQERHLRDIGRRILHQIDPDDPKACLGTLPHAPQ
jgi:hypothetical protein